MCKCRLKDKKNTQSKAVTLLLESCVSSVKPASTDTMMIDAISFWHFLTDTPSAFVSIAQYILPSAQQQAVKSIFSKM